MSDNCYACGYSVEWGSGRFVNRVPADPPQDAAAFFFVVDPDGEWLCAECLNQEEDE